MNYDSQIAQAIAQMFDEPLNYNALIAHALGSAKAAIVVDYLNARAAFQLPYPSNKELQDDLHMSAHEVRTIIENLKSKRILLKINEGYQIDPFFMDTVTYLVEHSSYQNKHSALDLLRSVSISRLNLKAIRANGGSLKSVILLSFIEDELSILDRVDRSRVYSDWFESKDPVWSEVSGMSAKEIRNAKQMLRKLKLIEVKKQGFPAKVYVRMNIQRLCAMTWEYAHQTPYEPELHISNENEPHVQSYFDAIHTPIPFSPYAFVTH